MSTATKKVASTIPAKRTPKKTAGKVTSIKAAAGTIPSIQASGPVPAPQTKIRGYEGQVYYAVVGGATAAIFANVVDFDIDVKIDSIDASDRSTVGWKDKLGGLKEWTGTIKANAIQSGVDLLAFYAALTGGLSLTGSFRPQDITGGLAYTGGFVITGYKHNAANSGLQTIDLNIEGRGPLVLGLVAAGGAA